MKLSHLSDSHALAFEDVLRESRADASAGLGTSEVRDRLAAFGCNELPTARREAAVVRFLRHFNDVLIYVLLAAAALTAVLRHWADTLVIAAVVAVNATVGFLQEGRAERALEGIRQLLSPTATVLRDGSWQQIPAEELVPGDLVRLRAGDRVPADLRLGEAQELSAEESALTGESLPALKGAEPVASEAPLGDRSCMAFSGTMITAGAGTGVVVGTGADTEIGRISAMMSQVESLQTPLTRQIASFGRWLTVGVVVLTLALVLIGRLAHSTDLAELLQAAASFAVAAIPEGLPALITLTLALGVQTLAHRNTITRRLPAVQTLGSVTTICSDKTGTLTKNEMTVEQVVLAGIAGCGGQDLRVTGTGYAPDGQVLNTDGSVVGSDHLALSRLTEALSITNDTQLVRRDGRWAISGEPTEGALQSLAAKRGFDPAAFRRLRTLPFSSENKLMATVAEISGISRVLAKGAPDRLLDLSTSQLCADGTSVPLDRDFWEERVEQLSGEGLRVLAAAERPGLPEDADVLTLETLGQELTFLGFVGIVDPPREAATAAIKVCHAAGIKVKMITGDHIGTATAIARQMGLASDVAAVAGPQLEQADDDELRELATAHHVFARTSPEHKLRLVRALQAEGEVVAMTGDGVNDAPALRRADIGVAMGVKGTEVTKESADIVLADDDFTTIEVAIEEGRRIYDNLRKAVIFLLPTNGAQSAVVLLAVALGWTLPLTPLQVLWVNMITAVTLAFAFAFEPAEEGLMKRSPRHPAKGILEARHIVQVGVVSLLIAVATMGVFSWRIAAQDDIETARTLATSVLVICQAFYLFNVKTLERTSLKVSALFTNRMAWLCVLALTVLQLLFIYAPPLQRLFDSSPLSAEHLLIGSCLGAAVFLSTEALKMVLYSEGRSG